MNEIRFGLVGAGRHGVRYANHLIRGDIPGGRLTAVCRRDDELGASQAEEWGAAYHGDVRALAADERVDALLVVSLSSHHGESVAAAAAEGKPALVEKPLAGDLASCDRIAASADRSGIPVMVAQTSRYEGPILGLLEALPSIAPVREVFFSLRSEDRTHENGVFQERLDDGGALLDSGVHYFDLLPRIIGTLESAWCERHFRRGSPIDDGYTALFRSGGGRAVIDTGRWGGSRNESVEIVGEKGILLMSRTPYSLARIVGREREDLPFPEVPGTLIPTLLDFMRVCRGEIDPPITIRDGRAAVAVVDACLRSEGNWVEIG